MYRPKSNAVWFNLPGVVAAYQPVACPGGPLLARANVSNDQRTPGRYAAVPGVAPTFNPLVGHTFNGSNQYLKTSVIPGSGQDWSLLVAFANAANNDRYFAGYINTSSTSRMDVGPRSDAGSTWFFSNGTRYTASANSNTAGVLGVAGVGCYMDGLLAKNMASGTGGVPLEIFIGARNLDGGANAHCAVSIRAAAVASRTLLPAEMRLASHQMSYCHVNPDWSAWGRRRRYYYAPSAAAGLAFSPVGSGVVGSSVVRRIAA